MKIQNTLTIVLLAVIVGLLVWPRGEAGPTPTLAAPAAAQETVNTISVSGSSTIRVQPDRVTIVFGVEAIAATPREAQAENARLNREILKAIRDLGVDESDLSTVSFRIRPRYKSRYSKVVSDYESENRIIVTLRDVELLEQVLVDALEAGVTTVDSVELTVDNMRELRDQARELAVQAAMEKATAMTEAAGARLGNVTSISEYTPRYSYGYGSRYPSISNVAVELSDEGELSPDDASFSLGKIVVKAQVSLTAEIVPR